MRTRADPPLRMPLRFADKPHEVLPELAWLRPWVAVEVAAPAVAQVVLQPHQMMICPR